MNPSPAPRLRPLPLHPVTLALALAASAAVGQEPLPVPPQDATQGTPALTLDALVAEAWVNNPELKFYEAEMAAARAGRKAAGLLADPVVSGTVAHKSVRGGGLNAEGVAWSVAVLQPFEWPGRISLRKAIANHDIHLAELGLGRFKTALGGRMRTLAYGLFAAQEKAAAAAEVAERFKTLREVLVQREPAGLTPLLELRVIEATELNARRKASEASLATQSALLELNHLRGSAPETRFSVTPTHLSFRPAEATDVLLALAHTNNFELRSRAVELAQQGLRVDLARNQRLPSISVGPTLTEENAGGEHERIVGVAVSMPLPLWNRNRGGIEAAAARQMQADVSFRVATREIQRKVIEAALIYETKLREMAGWRPDAARHFREAAEVADRHYRLGAVPISTYVELQKQYLEAVEGLLDTRREALDATVQLEVLTGLATPLARASTAGEAR